MAATDLVLYTGLMMAITVGMTAWRLVAAEGKVGVQVDSVLGLCLVTSGVLFVAALLPGGQLP